MSDLKQAPRRIPKSKPAPKPGAAAKAKAAVPQKAVRGALLKAPEPLDRDLMIEVFRRLREANPEPRGELDYTNPYTLLVAVALSAQSTDVGVNKATRGLFAAADTPQAMLALASSLLLLLLSRAVARRERELAAAGEKGGGGAGALRTASPG